MSGTPSWVPPNHTQPRSPLPRVIRLAACTCTVDVGRKASRRAGSSARVWRTPSVDRGTGAAVVGDPPRSVAGGRWCRRRGGRRGGEGGGGQPVQGDPGRGGGRDRGDLPQA